MSETIRVRIFYDGVKVSRYLKKEGIADHAKEDDLFLVELRECPRILTQLQAAGYFQNTSFDAWHLMGMSERGLLLYLCHDKGDATIYIPMTNVICIHTIDSPQISAVRNPKRMMERHKHN